jgi:transcriptional regulator with XRE-family HTH domain
VHSFPKNLKRLRQIKGLTKRKLAALMGVSESQLYKWEKGIYVPNSENMNTLAKILGVSMRVLMEDADSRLPSSDVIVAHHDEKYVINRATDPEISRLLTIAEYLEQQRQEIYSFIDARNEAIALEQQEKSKAED